MDRDAVRIVLDSLPYLIVRHDDGSVARAHGPFTPGTEPHLAECTSDNQVSDPDLLARLEELIPISPVLPAAEATLAKGHPSQSNPTVAIDDADRA